MLQLCTACNKYVYQSRAEAGMQAKRTSSFASSTNLNTYSCPVGNGLHLGHNRKARRRPPAEEHRRDRMLRLPRYALAREWMTR